LDYEEQKRKFAERYGEKGVESIARLQPDNFEGLFAEFDDLDPAFTQTWLDHIYGNMYNRGIIPDKWRVLIVIGECVVSDEQIQIETHMKSAVRLGATPDEILEVILQAHVYSGMPKMIKSMRVYRRVMDELGLLQHRGINSGS
jgi:4-carboxymuconolactone decarboxylase